ncbi:MAG: hypothetical protein IPG59_14260 [Candidatus Melainabacteria bacterium]|nr:MAG: hypothetical protein IPG59_14260 [Candidatus Melainabacteria bacterium]
MLSIGKRVYVTDAVTAHYFGHETLKVVGADSQWIVFETEESDVNSFVGQEEYFTPLEVEDLIRRGLFRQLDS